MGTKGPSNGCNSCRNQKIKCNEIRPTCSRCERSGRDCVYRDGFESAHRDQRTIAKTCAEKKWRQRASEPPIMGENSTVNKGLASNQHLGTPYARLHEPLHQLAYQRFRYDFVMASGKNSPAEGTFSRLDFLYPMAPEDSCLFSAVTAVSCANLHGRLKSEEAQRASGLYYGKALQRLAALMAMSPSTVNSDEILVVILVLGLYETLTSASRDGSWMTHMRGTQSVIANRETISNEGNHIVAALCLHLLVYYISERIAPPPYFHGWLAQIPISFGRKVQLSGFMAETATLCSKLKSKFAPHEPFSGYAELLNAALLLDSHLESWTSQLPGDRRYTIQKIKSTNHSPWATTLLSLQGAPRLMEVYSNPLAATDWNMYRATRIQLNLSIWDFLGDSPELNDIVGGSGLKHRVLENIKNLAGQIACSVPYSLLITPEGGSSEPASTNEIHGLWGYMLMWPVSIALSCYKTDQLTDTDSIEQWLRTVLVFIRDSLGIAKADVCIIR